jgi:mRNA interferase RelE/StbE
VDCGEYRIIYRLDDDVLRIALIGKRNDDQVYEIFKRKN